jgi:eukaryotic-like serine/threonine-protein kinase
MNDCQEVSENALRNCPLCGRVIRKDAPVGMCPSCVLRSALVDEVLPSSAPMHFAGYDLLENLGEGGMGVVYKARQVSGNGRIVALKLIRDGEFANSYLRRRFVREIRMVAELRDAHIVPILEIGEYEREPYFTMEFMPGGNLARNAARYAGLRQAAQLIAKVARAAHVGHERRIVHRDLKPANILFDEEDEPRLADFGLAKQLDGDALTAQGDVIGTPAYMSPEQATGSSDRHTIAADIWSLGVVLYELIAGRRPFLGHSVVQVLARVVETEPEPLERVREDMHPELARICHKCLQKEPERRYVEARMLADELEAFARHAGPA